jgi:hypothetical protein
MKKESVNRKKSSKQAIMLKLAAIGGIVAPLLMILVMVSPSFITAGSVGAGVLLSLLSLIILASVVLFNLGFFIIGRRYESKSLKFASIAFIAWLVLFIIASGIITPKIMAIGKMVQDKIASLGLSTATLDQTGAQSLVASLQQDSSFNALAPGVFMAMAIGLLVFAVLLLIISIFYSIGIMKSGTPSSYPNMNMERFTGILGLICIGSFIASLVLPLIFSFLSGTGQAIIAGIASLLSLIGIVLMILVYILQVTILFKESRKL